MKRNGLLFWITLLIFPITYLGLGTLLLHLAGYNYIYEWPLIYGTFFSWIGYIVTLAAQWGVVVRQSNPRLAGIMVLSAALVFACDWGVMVVAGYAGLVLLGFLPALFILTLLHLVDNFSGNFTSRG